MFDEDDWMNGYGDKIGAYQRVPQCDVRVYDCLKDDDEKELTSNVQ